MARPPQNSLISVGNESGAGLGAFGLHPKMHALNGCGSCYLGSTYSLIETGSIGVQGRQSLRHETECEVAPLASQAFKVHRVAFVTSLRV